VDGDKEENSVEDNNAEDYGNQVPSGPRDFYTAELHMNGVEHSINIQPSQSRTADMQIADRNDQSPSSDRRYVIHRQPPASRRRHSGLVTSLQVR